MELTYIGRGILSLVKTPKYQWRLLCYRKECKHAIKMVMSLGRDILSLGKTPKYQGRLLCYRKECKHAIKMILSYLGKDLFRLGKA